MSKRIGLFFGSFNPIHVGHLILCNHLAEHSDLNEIWLVVSPHNPFKEKSSLLSDMHRLTLVRLATEDNSKLKASNIEFDLPKPSYTVQTLAYLKEKHPEHQFSLIMGEDNLRGLHKWKNVSEIIQNHVIYVYPRIRTVQEEGKELSDKPHESLQGADFRFIDGPILALSASLIRKNINEGKSVKYLLTPEVEKYVDEMHFYRD
ncbi:MAG: nicotinate (nicotinamide) nucleotide adenylyltransferase [Flavobacteriales bacterium]